MMTRDRITAWLTGIGLTIWVVVAFAADDRRTTVPDPASTIDAIVGSEGPYSYTLVEPLTHQYEAAMAAGDLELARETLLTIQHLIHREYGVLTPRQRSVLEKLAIVHLRSRQADDADSAHRLSHYIATRQYADDWSLLAPELRSLIEWQITTGQFRRARRELSNAIERAEEENDTLSIAGFLIQSAQLRQFSWYCCSRRYVDRAIDLLEEMPSDVDAAPMHTQIADLLLASNDVEGARFHYEQANQINAGGGYTEPTPLPGKYVLPNIISAATIRGTVTRSGRVSTPASSLQSPDIDPADIWESQLQGGKSPQVARLLSTNMTGGVILNRNRQDPASERQVYFVGKPIEFVESQIYHELPRSQKNVDTLANMSLSFRVSITSDGRVRDIVAMDETRRSPLYRTVWRALRVLRFRPALLNGKPVDHVLDFTQTFPRVLAPGKKDGKSGAYSLSVGKPAGEAQQEARTDLQTAPALDDSSGHEHSVF